MSSEPNNPPDVRPRMPLSSAEIRRWGTSKNEVVIVELQNYADGRVVDVRRWYYDAGKILRPGRTGISLPISDVSELAAALESIRVALTKPLSGLAALRSPANTPHEPEPESEPDIEIAPAIQMSNPSRIPFLHMGQPRGAPVLAKTPKPDAPAPEALAPPQQEKQTNVTAFPHAHTPPPGQVTLAAIIERGLVRSPLPIRIDGSEGRHSGLAYADGRIIFNNRTFSTPREAVVALRGLKNVVDAWQFIRYLNPATRRFTKLSRLRNLYLGLEEADAAGGEGD